MLVVDDDWVDEAALEYSMEPPNAALSFSAVVLLKRSLASSNSTSSWAGPKRTSPSIPFPALTALAKAMIFWRKRW